MSLLSMMRLGGNSDEQESSISPFLSLVVYWPLHKNDTNILFTSQFTILQHFRSCSKNFSLIGKAG